MCVLNGASPKGYRLLSWEADNPGGLGTSFLGRFDWLPGALMGLAQRKPAIRDGLKGEDMRENIYHGRALRWIKSTTPNPPT